MKKSLILLSAICLLLMCNKLNAQTPPYSGTIFIDPDIITSADPSAIQSTTYTGQGMRKVYDRRVNKWVNINAYLFNVVWKDSLTSEAIINPEFGSVANATKEAEKYAFLIGQLPYSLRVDVDGIWVNKGVNPFGGGNKSILIHTGQSVNYESSGILEETLVHEGSHTSLDFDHSAAVGWTDAQKLDGNFISTYARDNPTREDIAETFLTWLMVRYRASKISTTDYNKITKAIPNRLLYFDNKSFNLSPFYNNTVSNTVSTNEVSYYTPTNEVSDYKHKISISPNPSSDFIKISGAITPLKYEIYNILGNKILEGINSENKMISIQNIPNNLYFLKLENGSSLKFIKE